MKKINISTPKYPNTFTLVDDKDYAYVNKWKWTCSHSSVVRRAWVEKKKFKALALHRVITGAPQNMLVDHINHNILDNRKCNLRVCTRSQNAMNMIKTKNIKSSKFKGVTKSKSKKRWRSYIKIKQKQINLGHFTTELEGAKAYNLAALKYFGEFAYLNKV